MVLKTGNGQRIGVVAAFISVFASGQGWAQRTAENAVAEADDAFGTTISTEVIGLYSSTSARGFNPSAAGNLRINGLYFDQAASPVTRIVRGSTMHVGISAQGYPFPAPTGVVDFALRTPGDNFVTSVVATHGAVGSYTRTLTEIDTQMPVVKDVLSIGAGVSVKRNTAHEVAVRDKGYELGFTAHWRPTERLSVMPFWSRFKTDAVSGDRPKIYIGNNIAPRFRADDMTSPEWLYYGFRQYNYGVASTLDLPDRWALKAGLFRSESNFPRSFTAFLLNTNTAGVGDYAIEQTPERYTRSTSGEARLSKTMTEGPRKHTGYATVRGRDRDSTFGGGQLKRFGTARLGAFPDLPEPAYQTTTPSRTETRQVTGGLGYEGVWRDVGQLSVALQKSDYERTVFVPGTAPVTGSDAPWLYNVGAASYISSRLAVYGGYTRGLEELGAAPGNAVNRDEVVPAQRTSQVDAGVRYQLAPKLQLVAGVFNIAKPYYGLDPRNVYRDLGDIRHRGVEVSVAGPVSDALTVVAGAVALQPCITNSAGVGAARRLTAVGPIPLLTRVNLQYRPPGLHGVLFDTKVEYVSSRYLTANNLQRIGGAVTWDAGVRYTTTLADTPVRFRLQGLNLTNTFSVTPQASGQIAPYEARRVEFSIAADF